MTTTTRRFLSLCKNLCIFVPLVILVCEIHVLHNHLNHSSRQYDNASLLFPPNSHHQKYIPIGPYRNVSLVNLTRSLHIPTCPEGLTAVVDTTSPPPSFNTRRVPKIIHQTGRSRCMTKWMKDLGNKWRERLPDHEYYFHDDEAMERLLHQEWPMFPHIAIMSQCLNQHGTAKSDLWRYLVLWEYGGIYADLDTAPNLFNASTLANDTDGFFIVEQYHMLSQFFMAVSPKHPVMYYAIQHTLANILQLPDTGLFGTPYVTGPHALHKGFQAFMADVGVSIQSFKRGALPVSAQTYVGTNGRSVTAVGKAENENEYLRREAIKRWQKIKEYSKMNMTHFTQAQVKRNGKSCVRVLLEQQEARRRNQQETI